MIILIPLIDPLETAISAGTPANTASEMSMINRAGLVRVKVTKLALRLPSISIVEPLTSIRLIELRETRSWASAVEAMHQAARAPKRLTTPFGSPQHQTYTKLLEASCALQGTTRSGSTNFLATEKSV